MDKDSDLSRIRRSRVFLTSCPYLLATPTAHLNTQSLSTDHHYPRTSVSARYLPAIVALIFFLT